jgi:hypothetical protein
MENKNQPKKRNSLLALGTITNLLIVKFIEEEKLRLSLEEIKELSRKSRRLKILKIKQKFRWLYRVGKNFIKKLINNICLYRNTYLLALILLSISIAGVFIYKNTVSLNIVHRRLNHVYLTQLNMEEKAAKSLVIFNKAMNAQLKEINELKERLMVLQNSIQTYLLVPPTFSFT